MSGVFWGNQVSPNVPQSMLNGTGISSIQYPSFSRPSPSASPMTNGINSPSSATSPQPSLYNTVSPPPQASINHSPLSRRRSDYIDNSHEALSTFSSSAVSRGPIDYPDISQQILRPPPVAATPALERQDSRPRLGHQHHGHSFSLAAPSSTSSSVTNGAPAFPMTVTNGLSGPPQPPTIPGSVYPVTYWADVQIGKSGLRNLGNTCYMNATMQCLSATVPFARFFTGASSLPPVSV